MFDPQNVVLARIARAEGMRHRTTVLGLHDTAAEWGRVVTELEAELERLRAR